MFVLIFDYFYEREDNPDLISIMNFVRGLTVVVLLFELVLNNINVRFDQYPATIAWTILYLLFIWPAVFTKQMKEWPYSLLQTRTKNCFLYYPLLFLFNFGCYLLWWIIYKIKKECYIYYNIGRYVDYNDQETELSEHEFMLLQQTMNPLSSHGNSSSGIQVDGGYFDNDNFSTSASAYTIDGYPVDYTGQPFEQEGLLYHPDMFVQGAYYAEDGSIIYPEGVQPPTDSYPSGYYDENETIYSSPYSYEHYSPFIYPNTGYPAGSPEFQHNAPWNGQGPMSPEYAGHWDYEGHPVGEGEVYSPYYHQQQQQQQYQHHQQYEQARLNHLSNINNGSSTYPPHPPSESFYSTDSYGYTIEDANTPTLDEPDAMEIYNPSSTGSGSSRVGEGVAGRRALPPRSYDGSALQRRRSGRGPGGSSGGRGSSSMHYTNQHAPVPGAITVTAEALDESEVATTTPHIEDNDNSGFDYNVVNSWASFRASGNIPHNSTEAGVIKPNSDTTKTGGFFTSLFGKNTSINDIKPIKPIKEIKKIEKKPINNKENDWFEQDEYEDFDFDEEINFNTNITTDNIDIPLEEGSVHKSGAFVAMAAKKDAFHTPNILSNPRRKSGDSIRLQQKVNQNPALSPPSTSILRPPSLHNLFRTKSRDRGNSFGGERSLELQPLGTIESEHSHNASSLKPPLSPNITTITTPNSNNHSSSNILQRMFRGNSKDTMSLQLQELGTIENEEGKTTRLRTSSQGDGKSPLLRTPSSGKILRTFSTDIGGEGGGIGSSGFDYNQLDAWTSFRAGGNIPHTKEEANLDDIPNIKVGGLEELNPHTELRTAVYNNNKSLHQSHHNNDNNSDNSSSNSSNNSDQEEHTLHEESEHYLPESTVQSHKSGAYIASSAKKEAFHTPASFQRHSNPLRGQRQNNSNTTTTTTTDTTSSMVIETEPQQQQQSSTTNTGSSSPLKSMFRAPSVPRIFRPKSKEAMSLNLQPLGDLDDSNNRHIGSPKKSMRKSSEHNLPRTGSSMFDYSGMNAWTSFRADGSVPHTAAEADLSTIPTIKVGGGGIINPHAEIINPHSEKDRIGDIVNDSRKDDGWYDINPTQIEGNGGVYRVPESTGESHKFGAYIATAAKGEAFHSPSTLQSHAHSQNNPLRRGRGSTSTPTTPTTASTTSTPVPPATTVSSVSPKGLLRPPSVTRLLRSMSRERNLPLPPTSTTTSTTAPAKSPVKRSLNLQKLSTTTNNSSSSHNILSTTTHRSPLPPPPPTASAIGVVGVGDDTHQLTDKKGSFFDYPTVQREEYEGSDSGDSDDNFRMG